MNLDNENLDNERLEKALRASLEREAAPPDFAAKVLARAGSLPAAPLEFHATQSGLRVARTRPKSWLQQPFGLALAAALAATAIVPAVVLDYQRREQARGLKAKHDLLTALAITRDQLRQAREKVRRAGSTYQGVIHEN